MGNKSSYAQIAEVALRLNFMDVLVSFLGRFHPLLVHLPIGILILAFLFEILSLLKQFSHLKQSVAVTIFIGSLAAIFSCISGYFLSLGGGYSDKLLERHQYLGIATAGFSLLLFFILERNAINNGRSKYLRLLFFTPLIVMLSVTGHMGGSLTHGEDFLSFSILETDDQPFFKPIANVDTAILYEHVVKPIFQSRCYSCHSSKKQKGDLRLDEIKFIQRGGKNGEIILSGLADSSSLYAQLVLPLEDEHHMPPKGKPQPTSTEIAILKFWIDGGAGFDKRVNQFAKAEKVKDYINSMQSAVTQHWIPKEEVTAADEKAIAALQKNGVHILPVHQDSRYLMVNFINADSISDAELNGLLQIKDQLVWMSLEGSTISDAQCSAIGKLKNLRWLYLNDTKISDSAIQSLSQLPELIYLNLVNTAVTDQSIKHLSQLKKLKQLYLFGTELSRTASSEFRQSIPHTVIDIGNYVLPELASDTIVYKR